VRRAVDQLLGDAFAPSLPAGNEPGLPDLSGPQDPTAAEVAEMRRAAAAELVKGETSLLSMAVEWWGPAAAERIYGTGLVHRAQQLASMTSLSEFGIDRGQK
jgi:hypothetical protein